MDKQKVIANISSLTAKQLFDEIKQGKVTLGELKATGNLDFMKRKEIIALQAQFYSQDHVVGKRARSNKPVILKYTSLSSSRRKYLARSKIIKPRHVIDKTQVKTNTTRVLISYSWNDKEYLAPFFERLKEILDKIGIEIIRDKFELNYKGSINDFMHKDGEGKFIILLITDNYLKSKNCMFEFNEIIRSEKFNNRYIPIITENANIFSINNSIKYINFWNNKINEIKARIEELESDINSKEKNEEQYNISFYDLNIFSNIRNNLAHNLGSLLDMRVLKTDGDIEKTPGILSKKIETIIKLDKMKPERND